MMTAAIMLFCVGVAALIVHGVVRMLTQSPLFALKHTEKIFQYIQESSPKERTILERNVSRLTLTVRLESVRREQQAAAGKLATAGYEDSLKLMDEITRLAKEMNRGLAIILKTRFAASGAAKSACDLLHASNRFHDMLAKRTSDSTEMSAHRERAERAARFEEELGSEPLAVLLFTIVDLSIFGSDERTLATMKRTDAVLEAINTSMRTDAPVESVPMALRKIRRATNRAVRAVRWATFWPTYDAFTERTDELLSEIEQFVKEMY
jgi:hypothetical protein